MAPHATQDLKSVPTGTNNWWKEATVYQVSSLTLNVVREANHGSRSIQHLSMTPMATDGVIYLA